MTGGTLPARAWSRYTAAALDGQPVQAFPARPTDAEPTPSPLPTPSLEPLPPREDPGPRELVAPSPGAPLDLGD